MKSRMTGDCQVRFCERLEADQSVSWPTRLLFDYFEFHYFLAFTRYCYNICSASFN